MKKVKKLMFLTALCAIISCGPSGGETSNNTPTPIPTNPNKPIELTPVDNEPINPNKPIELTPVKKDILK